MRLPKVIILSLVSGSLQLMAAPFQFVDLGTLGGPQSQAIAINQAGLVTGTSEGPKKPNSEELQFLDHGFLFNGAALVDLGALNNNAKNNRSIGFAINQAGVIVGESEIQTNQDPENPTFATRTFRFQNGAMTDIGVIKQDGLTVSSSQGRGINDAGKIVGIMKVQEGASAVVSRGYVFDPTQPADKAFTLISPLSGDKTHETDLRAINNQGKATGFSNSTAENNIAHATLFDPTLNPSLIDLGTLGGPASFGFDINEQGHVVGRAQNAAQEFHAFLHNGTAMIDLGVLDTRFPFSQAFALNDTDHVVGIAQVDITQDQKQIMHAFLHDGSKMLDLNTQVDCKQTINGQPATIILVDAHDINNAGQIVGTAVVVQNGQAQEHAYRLDPTPNGGPAIPCDPPVPPPNGGGGHWSWWWCAVLSLCFLFSGLRLPSMITKPVDGASAP